jgi:two-component sensor histidine kinase
MRDKIKELEEKITNNLSLISLENKLDIKPIKEEMNKLIELHKMESRIQKMEKQKQSTQEGEVKANLNMRDRIKELEEKLTNNLALISLENKLDIKPIKEEMNKLI